MTFFKELFDFMDFLVVYSNTSVVEVKNIKLFLCAFCCVKPIFQPVVRTCPHVLSADAIKSESFGFVALPCFKAH